jgi:large subunit ribosomal protein L18
MDKKSVRLRRAKKTRARIKKTGAIRFCVHKTSQHIYAQIISADNTKTLVSASTLDKAFKETEKYGGNVQAAIGIGKDIAERAKLLGITKVAFDRSGFKYHGRIKALADSAREHGLEF